MKKIRLEKILQSLAPIARPQASMEQISTPAGIVAEVAYLAYARGDIGGRTVLDLGCGNGTLAIAAKLLGAAKAVGVDSDARAIDTARANGERLAVDVAWRVSNVTSVEDPVDTVLMNPPFGAQTAHADRPFLDAALRCGRVIYSFANGRAEAFVRRYLAARNGRITDILPYAFPVPRTFGFHRDDIRRIDVVLLRAEVAKE